MMQDLPFIWKSSLGGPVSWVGKSLGITKVSQSVLARFLESQIWHQLASCVGRVFRNGTMASARLDTRPLNFSLDTTGTFQAATLVLELTGNESEYVSCMWVL